MAEFGVSYNFEGPLAKPIDGDAPPRVESPQAAGDSSEYICGDTGNAHPYANAGRDQDRNRLDERIPAQAYSKYVR
jgi:hypothetical protein